MDRWGLEGVVGGGRAAPVKGSGSGSRATSASERERTKLRERQRRAITTKIFNGLRKHGGYDLPPRADINDVLRALAAEAGWVVEADGTTYRANKQNPPAESEFWQGPACKAHNQQRFRYGEHNFSTATATGGAGGAFSCSFTGFIAENMESRGGESSTTASPIRASPLRIVMPISSKTASSSLRPAASLPSPFASPASSEVAGFTSPNLVPDGALSLSLSKNDLTTTYIGSEEPAGFVVSNNNLGGFGFGMDGNLTSIGMLLQQQSLMLQEAWASTQNSPIGSPQRHG